MIQLLTQGNGVVVPTGNSEMRCCTENPTMQPKCSISHGLWFMVTSFLLHHSVTVSGHFSSRRFLCQRPGVTGQNIPRPEYTQVYYSLGQFIHRGIFWPKPIYTPSGANVYLGVKIGPGHNIPEYNLA